MKTTRVTIDNARDLLDADLLLIKKARLYRSADKWKQYVLLETIELELTNGRLITIKKGFTWDLSSVPRMFWTILPPDGDFELAALIHDYLYQNKVGTRKEADLEMLLWSKAVNGTHRVSMRRIDNYTRYIAVRLFGWIVWRK